MLLDDVATALETAGVGTVKTSGNSPTWPVYKGGRVPATPTQGLLWLKEYQLAGPIREMSATLGAMVAEEVGLSVQVRHADYDTARSKAEAVVTALHNLTGTLGSTRYLLVELTGTPVEVSRDTDASHVFATSFKVTKERG